MFDQKLICLIAASVLGGCGSEVAGTAATTGGLQAAQIEQAKAQEALIKQQLGEAMNAMKAANAAASAAGSQ